MLILLGFPKKVQIVRFLHDQEKRTYFGHIKVTSALRVGPKEKFVSSRDVLY